MSRISETPPHTLIFTGSVYHEIVLLRDVVPQISKDPCIQIMLSLCSKDVGVVFTQMFQVILKPCREVSAGDGMLLFYGYPWWAINAKSLTEPGVKLVDEADMVPPSDQQILFDCTIRKKISVHLQHTRRRNPPVIRTYLQLDRHRDIPRS